ncbi:MAG: hypothetical protein L6Q97_27645, partial [Thermoanaerobaculia bacterium]|nr:hypothetical protein [Thermoanaerobaculia bacterium]
NTNRAANRLGKLYHHYDEAGLLTFENHDFKGNILEKVRQVISDAAILKVFEQGASRNWQVQAFRVDWQLANANALLDLTEYRTSTTYDGLNRMKMLRYPQDVDSLRKELRPHYNRAGALERVELDGVVYVDHIAYNAKGQRTLIAYGNGVMTRYAYESQTFRLVRMRTERFGTDPVDPPKPPRKGCLGRLLPLTQFSQQSQVSGMATPPPEFAAGTHGEIGEQVVQQDLTYHPTGAPLQDFGYAYDLAGNILT